MSRIVAICGAALLLAVGCGTSSAGLALGSPGAATPTPAALRDYGQPPAGVALVYIEDEAHLGWYTGYDWTGRPRGTVKTDPSLHLVQSPDASTFELWLGPKGGSPGFLDRLARPIAGPGNPSSTVNVVWAGDSAQACLVTLDQDTFAWALATQQPGQSARQVAVIAHDQGIAQTGIGVSACSVRNDVAILLRTSIYWPSEIWAVRLSDGSVLSHHSYAAASLGTVVASPDSTLVAESSSSSQGSSAQGASTTSIRRVSDWSIVASLAPTDQVLAFSGDGSLALISTQPDTGTGPSHLVVMDWRAGRTVWRYDGPGELYRNISEPDGKGFALAMESPTTTGTPAWIGVVIVAGDGTVHDLPSGWMPAW